MSSAFRRDGTRHEGGALDRLTSAVRRLGGTKVTLDALLGSLGAGAWGLCFLLLGSAGFVPGVAPVFGVALVTAAICLVVGLKQPWVPRRIGLVQVDRQRLLDGLQKIQPKLEWVERWMRPRRIAVPEAVLLRLAGVATLVNGVLVVLPIPFGNTAPAIATVIVALGLVIGDGLAVVAGLVASVVALAFDIAFIWVGYRAVTGLLAHIF